MGGAIVLIACDHLEHVGAPAESSESAAAHYVLGMEGAPRLF